MKIIIKVLLVIVWMGVIFCFSNQKATASSRLSDGLIKNTIGKVFNINEKEKLDSFIKPVRKSAHFFLYFVLGLLVLNCFSNINSKSIIYSILICFIYSISDEFHQLFIDGRSAEVLDVFIDTLGASLGVFVNRKVRSIKSR